MHTDEIEAVARSMLQAGSETLAGTTAMCIARLSTGDEPEIQEKAYEESV
jgi:hypothetical protein